jgi:hypothetical protein
LIKLLFPTLLRPKKTYSDDVDWGYFVGSLVMTAKEAEVIFILSL